MTTIHIKDWELRYEFIEHRRKSWLPKGKFFLPLVLGLIIAFTCIMAVIARGDEVWKITAYCACVHCCGKTDAITASGKKAQYGMVACNWLPFGSKVRIAGLGEFVVADRDAKSQFGSKRNHIRHLDVFMASHRQALKFGVQYRQVEVI